MESLTDILCDPEVHFCVVLCFIFMTWYLIMYIREWHRELEEERKKNSIFKKANKKVIYGIVYTKCKNGWYERPLTDEEIEMINDGDL